jgi:hypothetical protein
MNNLFEKLILDMYMDYIFTCKQIFQQKTFVSKQTVVAMLFVWK